MAPVRASACPQQTWLLVIRSTQHAKIAGTTGHTPVNA